MFAASHVTLIRAGAVGEGFELELGPWTVLGRQALTQQSYSPDFDAVALAPCRLLRLTRPAFLAALEAAQVPAILNQVGDRFLGIRMPVTHSHINVCFLPQSVQFFFQGFPLRFRNSPQGRTATDLLIVFLRFFGSP